MHELVHGRARKRGLAVRVREQLDGHDVGIGIGDAARHHRACIGLRLAYMPQPRHKINKRSDIQRQPDQKRQDQLQVKCAGQHRHGDDVDRHGHQHVGQHKQGVAHGQRRLHDLGGQAAGKLVLVKGHALAQHQPVEIPAQAHGEIDRQRLVLDDGLQGDNHNAGQNDACQYFQRAALFDPQSSWLCCTQPVHDAAQHGEHQGLKGGHGGRQQGQRQDVAARPRAAGPEKGDKTPGCGRWFGFRVGVQQPFKGFEQGHRFAGPRQAMSSSRRSRPPVLMATMACSRTLGLAW